MPKPVITQPPTPRIIAQGIAIPPLTLVATNAPESWSATRLPPGLSLDDVAGTITGTPTSAGLVETVIVATNEDGASEAVSLVWNVQAQPVGAGNWDDMEVDFDLIERTVTIPGVTREAGAPLFSVARDDKFHLLVGARKFGVLRDIQPGGENIAVRLALKEFEPELVLTLAGGVPVKSGSDDSTRFRIPVWVDPARWTGALADYEADAGTVLLSVAELEIRVGDVFYQQTKVTHFPLKGNMTGDYGDHPPLSRTLVFDGLRDPDDRSYSLTVSLSVAGRPGQNVTIQQSMQIAFAGGVWVVTDVDGGASAIGAEDGDHWRVTAAITDIEGDADSVDVDVTIETSEDAGVLYAYDLDFASYRTFYVSSFLTAPEASFALEHSPYLHLHDSDEAPLGSTMLNRMDGAGWTYDNLDHFIETLAARWNEINGIGVDEIVSVEAISDSILRVWVSAGATARFATLYGSSEGLGALNGPSVIPGDGSTAVSTLTGVLVQTTGVPPSRYTAQFQVAVMRDLVSD